LDEYYQAPILLFIIGFALWNRIRNWENFVVDGEVIPAANDPWYHMRSTEYAVRNFPTNMAFDPWTQFPFGTFAAQFGTLFDQVIAFFALIVGLGSPSQFTTRFVFMISPAFWVALVCIPAYIIGRRLGGRFGGLIAAGFVAFAPDRLLAQGVAGNVQHHTAEALFMALGMLGLMVALTVAEQEKPVYELIAAREFEALRGPVGWSMLAGLAIGMYVWVWPPGIWLYGILGVFFIIHMSAEHVRHHSHERGTRPWQEPGTPSIRRRGRTVDRRPHAASPVPVVRDVLDGQGYPPAWHGSRRRRRCRLPGVAFQRGRFTRRESPCLPRCRCRVDSAVCWPRLCAAARYFRLLLRSGRPCARVHHLTERNCGHRR
ncbi:hypothetical protein BRC66_06680, partial [Halobacteriales archaeon QH_2_66_30]